MRDERLLLERAREYDPKALGEIYDGYSEKIYHYICRYLGEARLAEDLKAEVFLKLLEAIKASKGPRTHLSAWLYRVAHNLVSDTDDDYDDDDDKADDADDAHDDDDDDDDDD